MRKQGNHIQAIFFCASFLLGVIQSSSAFGALVGEEPIIVPGPASHFDFMGVDQNAHRILAAHTGASTLEMIDLASGKPMKAIDVGDAQGVAVDYKRHEYFLGNKDKESVVILNSRTLVKTSEVKVNGPVDAMTFDSRNGLLYAAKDDGTLLWVIDPKLSKVIATVKIPGVPEVLEYDPKTDRVYLNIKDKDLVVRINPRTSKVDAKWSTLPATSPHGLAIDSARGRVFVGGKNGKLISISMKTGKILSSTELPSGVDQIAFDPDKRLVYSACKGFIAISEDQDSGLRSVSQTPSPKGAHTLAVDPKTKDVWVSFSDEHHSYFQKFRDKPTAL